LKRLTKERLLKKSQKKRKRPEKTSKVTIVLYFLVETPKMKLRW
jgi:hypothetical protein